MQRVPAQLQTRARPYQRRVLCAMGLLPVFLIVHCMAYWLRFEGQLGERELNNMARTIAQVVCLKLLVFGWFRIYEGWSRYLTFHDLITIVQASTASSLVLAFAHYLLFPSRLIPRSVFLMDWGGTIVAIGALRSVARLVEERGLFIRNASKKTPVLIVGANDSGETLLRIIRCNRNLPHRVVGFITEDAARLGSRIGGVPVLGPLAETCAIAQRHRVPEVLITAGELSGKQVRQLVDQGRLCGVGVKVLPSYEQLLHGNFDMRPRAVSIEDILRRDPVQLDQRGPHRWIADQVLLVTGSAGSIGSEICRQLLQFAPRQLVLVDRSENGQFFLQRQLQELAPDRKVHICVADANDTQRMESIIQRHRPDIIFHAAAYKHVPLMEVNCGEAIKNIVLMTQRLADLASKNGVPSFVLISTDKAVNPTSVMGACKRVAELYVQSLAQTSSCRFVTVRFGNVLDSAGSVVPIFREQIARGGPVTVTHPDMVRYFMMIPEAAQLVIQAGAMGQGGEIFVLDMGDPVRIVDLASDLIRLSGLRVGEDIEIKFTGMRPGEKLYEELRLDGEEQITTSHPKITVAESERVGTENISRAIRRLTNLTEDSTDRVLQELSRIVPQFQHDHLARQTNRQRRAA